MMAFFGVFGATAVCVSVGAIWELWEEQRSFPFGMLSAAIIGVIGLLMLTSAVLSTVVGV